MSFASREPLWYCHECHSEMRPLRAPDPVCASCRGTFVEQMEPNSEDDPRAFQQLAGHTHDPDAHDHGDPGDFFATLNQLMNRTMAVGPNTTGTTTTTFRSGGGGTFTFGGTNTLGGSRTRTRSDDVPTLADFVLRGPQAPGIDGDHFGPRDPNQREGIAGPVLAQYLAALLGATHGTGAGSPFGATGGPGGGRWGDYVFNQEALDEIITQLMETSVSGKPIPATEEITNKLPREILEEGSSTLEKDCAVCKEQFSLMSDDPDEQIVVTLPCSHPFHEPCILPWLKSSGTCPVCRHALIPQPEHHAPGEPGPSSGSGGPPPRSSPRIPDNGPGGLFSSLMGLIGGGGPSSGPANTAGGPSGQHGATRLGETSSRRGQNGAQRQPPGAWEDLD